MPNFVFIFLLLLNFQLPNLSSATSPFQFLFDKIESFDEQFLKECIKFRENIREIVGNRMLSVMGSEFNQAIEIIALIGQIPPLKKNVEKFLKGGNFEEFSRKLDFIKIEEQKIDALAALAYKLENEMNEEGAKKMKEKIKNEKGKHSGTNPHEKEGNEAKSEEIPLEGRLQLVRELLELCKMGNNFLDNVRAELQIRQPMENFATFFNELEGGRIKIEEYFEEFFNKNYAVAFQKIVNLMKGVKRELRDANGKQPRIPFSDAALKYKNGQKEMPSILAHNEMELRKALSDENPLLEAPEFEAAPNSELILSGIAEINNHHEEMRELIRNSAKQFQKVLNKDHFFKQKQQEYSNSRDLELLNSACHVMFKMMAKLLLGKILKLEENHYLADIRWLADFIKEKIQKIEENPAKMDLPPELAVGHFNGKIILSAENILSIYMEINKIHDFEKASRQIGLEEEGKGKLNNLMMKGMNAGAENVCGFFYEKYVEIEKQKDKIGQMEEGEEGSSSAKIGEHSSKQVNERMDAELAHSMGGILLKNNDNSKNESKGKQHTKEEGPSSV